jgi:hypothetical protein
MTMSNGERPEDKKFPFAGWVMFLLIALMAIASRGRLLHVSNSPPQNPLLLWWLVSLGGLFTLVCVYVGWANKRDAKNIDSKQRLNNEKLNRFEAIYPALKGTEGVFKEYPIICHVRIESVSADAWGVRIKITDLLTSGMIALPRNPCGLAASWEVFSFYEYAWHSGYPGTWRISFDRQLLLDVTKMGAEAHQKSRQIEYDFAARTMAKHDSKQLDEIVGKWQQEQAKEQASNPEK